MTWQSASWEISLRQTTSVKRRNTGERRQVTIMLGLDLWSHDLAEVHTDSFLIYFQEAMRQLAGLLPDGLKQEIYGLWEVASIAPWFLLIIWGRWNSSKNASTWTSFVGIREPEQPRGPAGQRVWPSWDDPAGSRVRGTGGDARKTAGVLWLHQRYV